MKKGINHEEFGERLQEIVRRSRKSQVEFAAEMGVSSATQYNYVKGTLIPDVAYLERLYHAGYDVLYLITGEWGVPALLTEDSALLARWHRLPPLVQQAAKHLIYADYDTADAGRTER